MNQILQKHQYSHSHSKYHRSIYCNYWLHTESSLTPVFVEPTESHREIKRQKLAK